MLKRLLMKNWACAALLLGTHCDSHYEYRIGCEDMMQVIWSTDHAAEHALTQTALHQMHKCCDAVSNLVNCSAGCCHHVLMPCITWQARRVLCNVIVTAINLAVWSCWYHKNKAKITVKRIWRVRHLLNIRGLCLYKKQLHGHTLFCQSQNTFYWGFAIVEICQNTQLCLCIQQKPVSAQSVEYLSVTTKTGARYIIYLQVGLKHKQTRDKGWEVAKQHNVTCNKLNGTTNVACWKHCQRQ